MAELTEVPINEDSNGISENDASRDHAEESSATFQPDRIFKNSPKRGPTTLSTSTSSYEAPETHDPTLNRLAVTMFEKTAAYLQSEMNCAQDEYQLLEQMNKATATKYREMRESASLIAQGLSDLNDKFLSLKPFLDQIDQIEDSVSKLEQAAYKLDAYTVRLEAKFKALEKR